jgi:nucleotide-binding universal stress UspA family protein
MTHTQKSIVAGVDGSAGSRAAVRVAAELANALDNRLVLVHAVHDPPPFPYGDARVRELERGRAVRDGERLLETVAGDVDAETQVVLGDPATRLDEAAYEHDAELIVVGARGHSGLAAVFVGSVSQRLASRATRPVMIVPPDADERFIAGTSWDSTIVSGFDGSEESRRALQVARRLGDRLDLEVVPVFVGPIDGGHDAPPVSVAVEMGDPVQELRERAAREHVRLLAVGSRGRGPIRQAFLGSVSAELAASAPCPVLVVPPTAVVIGDGDALAYDVAAR